MEIKKTNPDDIEALLPFYAKARELMNELGNPTQWGSNYPSRKLLEEDVAKGDLYTLLQDGQIVGGLVFAPGPEAVYETLKGSWLDDDPYYVIHRMAAPGAKGVAKWVFNWAMEQTDSLRIDTHADNAIMRHVLEREGFTYVGDILLPDGSRRRAYHRLGNEAIKNK